MKEEIEIEGQLYERIPDKSKQSTGRSRILMAAVAMASYSYGSSYKRERPSVNLVEEYKLILNKRSNLSKNDRDWVVNTFNKQYRKVS